MGDNFQQFSGKQEAVGGEVLKEARAWKGSRSALLNPEEAQHSGMPGLMKHWNEE